jgi:heterodisulfide reductase subunit A-like polyferredoxin
MNDRASELFASWYESGLSEQNAAVLAAGVVQAEALERVAHKLDLVADRLGDLTTRDPQLEALEGALLAVASELEAGRA